MFEDNYASQKGGGFHQGKGDVTISNCVFRNNSVGSFNPPEEGGDPVGLDEGRRP